MPAPEIDHWETETLAPLLIVALPPPSAIAPAPLVVPLRLAVPISESVSPLDMLSIEPTPWLKAPL